MEKTIGVNRAKSAPSGRRDVNNNNAIIGSNGSNQTRPLSSNTLDTTNNIMNENSINSNTNSNANNDNDNDNDNNYNDINENNDSKMNKERPKSNHTEITSLDGSSTSTDVRWILDTFDNNLISRNVNGKLSGPNGSLYEGSTSVIGESISLELFDHPGSNIPQTSMSLLPSTTSQKLISSSQGKRPVTDSSTPMMRALLISPYTEHRRIKTAATSNRPSKSSEAILKFIKPKKPSWSLDPFPSNGLFTEVQKQEDSKKQRNKYTSKLVKSWNEETLRLAKLATNASFQKNESQNLFINPTINSNNNYNNNNTSSSVNITSLSLPIIENPYFFSLSESGNEPIPSKEVVDSTEPDPLYRILREESEREVDIERLSNLLFQSGPIVANPGARRAEAELAAINPQMIKVEEIFSLSQFDTLPSNLWVIARVVYLLLVNYSEILSDENNGLLLQPPSLQREQTEYNKILDKKFGLLSPKTSKKTKKDVTENENYDIQFTDEQYISWLMNSDITLDTFWAALRRHREEYGITTHTALRKFSWPLLKELFMKPKQCAVAFYCIEKGGISFDSSVLSNDVTERFNIRDFYSIYPEEYLVSLREAAKPHAFHPNVIAMVSLPAGRVCAWARRVIAGILKIKQASLRYNFDDRQNFNSEDVSLIEYNDDKSKSLLSQLKISSDTNRQRLEQKISYTFKKDNPFSSDVSYFSIITMADGSTNLHAAYLAGLNISRPLDRYDIFIVGKNDPQEVKIIYEEITRLISNSPSHRVVTYRDMIEDSNNNDNDNTNNSCSFAEAVSRKEIQNNITDRLISMDMIDIITHSITNDYDICSVNLNTSISNDNVKINDLRRLFMGSKFQNRSRPFSLILANKQRQLSTPSLMTTSTISGYTHAPSKYVIFVNDSKLTVSMIQAISKPCDLIFLVFALIQTLKSDSGDNGMIEEQNYRSSIVANDLVLQYRTLGFNLHVEPIYIQHPKNTTDAKNLQYIATQMRHIASVFEPTYIVMDASYDDITLMAQKKMKNKKVNTNNNTSYNDKIVVASSLEDEDNNIYTITDVNNDNNDNNKMTLITTILDIEKQIVLSDRTISFILIVSPDKL